MRLRVAIPLAFILIVGVVLYRSSLGGFFLADDFGNVHLFSRTNLGAFPKLFADDWSQGIWGYNLQELRPLMGLTYWFDTRVWGTNPFGYHLENLLLYLLAVAGLYFLIIETGRSFPSKQPLSPIAITATAALGAFLFLVHPAHVEAEAWIAGRTDLFAAVTYLWAMAALARYWRESKTGFAVAGVLIFAAGLFLKENVITLPAAFWLYVAFTGNVKERSRRLIGISTPLIALALLWTSLRLIAFHAMGKAGNLSGLQGFIGRLPYYAGQSLPFGSTTILVTATGLLLCLIYGFYRWNSGGRMILYWGIGWTLLMLAPLLAVTYDSNRHLFLVVAGPITALAATAGMWRLSRPIVPLVAAALCFVLAVKLTRHSSNWLPVWNESSAYSRQLFELLKGGRYEAEDVVILNSGPPVPVFFWQWTLPFAVDEPFMDFRARIVADPGWYCCPQWEAKRTAIVQEISAGRAGRVHRIDFNPSTRRFEER